MNYAIEVHVVDGKVVNKNNDCPIFWNECRDKYGTLCEWHRGIISDNKILCGFYHIDLEGEPIISTITTSGRLDVEKGED